MGAEWTYLLTTRVVAGSANAFSYVRLKYGNNATDTVTGVVIYPDDFSFADAGVGAMTFGATAFTAIDIDSWRALERAGCVFLPGISTIGFTSSGFLNIDERFYGISTGYWSAIANSRSNAHYTDFNFLSRSVNTVAHYNRCNGMPVRLAQDY